MKNSMKNMMIATAAFVAVAGVASAQTMEAKIPFAFRAGGKVFEPGTYRVRVASRNTGVPIIAIGSLDPAQQVLAMGFNNGDAKNAWRDSGKAILSFQCGVGRCALSQIWMGDYNAPVYRLNVPNLGKDEHRTTAEIVMRQVKGD
jgi:hypothetical protein